MQTRNVRLVPWNVDQPCSLKERQDTKLVVRVGLSDGERLQHDAHTPVAQLVHRCVHVFQHGHLVTRTTQQTLQTHAPPKDNHLFFIKPREYRNLACSHGLHEVSRGNFEIISEECKKWKILNRIEEKWKILHRIEEKWKILQNSGKWSRFSQGRKLPNKGWRVNKEV